MRRNPIIASRKAQNLIPGRAQKLNGFIVNDYCAKHSCTTMDKLGVMNKTECIYDIEEKGCRFAFTNSLLYWYKKAENALICLKPNVGKMSPSYPVEMPVDQSNGH